MSTLLSPLDIEREAYTQPIADIAKYLQTTIGQKLTAYLAGLTDPKMVGKWASRQHAPQETVQMRLRCGYVAVRMITLAYSSETAKAWLLGSNTRLDDQAPSQVLRSAEKPDDISRIVPTAKALVETRVEA